MSLNIVKNNLRKHREMSAVDVFKRSSPRILVLPRFVVEELLESKEDLNLSKHAFISIVTRPEEVLMTSSAINFLSEADCTNILSLVFGDIIRPKAGYYLFDRVQACQIIDFINNLSDINILAIHCDAGVSRSGAVGLFACRYLNLNEKEFLEDNEFIDPNSHVYDLLMDECQ